MAEGNPTASFVNKLKEELLLIESSHQFKKQKTSSELFPEVSLTEEEERSLYDHAMNLILSKDQRIKQGFLYRTPKDPNTITYKPQPWNKPKVEGKTVCRRCSSLYLPEAQVMKNYVPQKECRYHVYKCKRKNGRGKPKHRCCGKRKNSPGCKVSPNHVSENYSFSNENVISTEMRGAEKRHLFSLDCEMCYTLTGFEVTKVSMVNYRGWVVYESLVKPEGKVVDYCTEFSGITKDDLKNETKRLGDVQRDLLEKIDSSTILVGHSLENDLKSLRIMHEIIIDTAVLFPHKRGGSCRQSLKYLVDKYLHYQFQEVGKSHNSSEDARACMHLLFLRILNIC